MNPDTIANGKNVVYFDYLNKLFDDKDVEELKELLEDKGVILFDHKHGPQIYGGILEFFANARFVFESEEFKAFLIGTGGSIFAQGISELLKFVRKQMHGKKVLMIQSGKKEEVNPNIQFVFGNTKVIIPIDVDDAKFNYFTDKFFEHLPKIDPDEDCVEKFDLVSETIVKVDIRDYVPESVKEQMEKS